jgi:hypothetical protein
MLGLAGAQGYVGQVGSSQTLHKVNRRNIILPCCLSLAIPEPRPTKLEQPLPH